MQNRYVPFAALLAVLLVLTACVPRQVEPAPEPTPSPEPPTPEPESELEALAILTSVIGDVTVNSEKASANQALPVNATVATGKESTAVITFLKGSVLRLDQNSEITISDISTTSIEIEQITGRSWSRVTRYNKPETYTVYTPYAVATVRGTAFSVDVTDEQSAISVADGAVATEADDISDTIQAGEQATANNEEIVVQPAALDEWTATNLDEDDTLAESIADSANIPEVDKLDIPDEEKRALRKAHVLGIIGAAQLTKERLANARLRARELQGKQALRAILKNRILRQQERLAAMAAAPEKADARQRPALRVHKKQNINARTADAVKENAFPLLKAAKTLREQREKNLEERRKAIQALRERRAKAVAKREALAPRPVEPDTTVTEPAEENNIDPTVNPDATDTTTTETPKPAITQSPETTGTDVTANTASDDGSAVQ